MKKSLFILFLVLFAKVNAQTKNDRPLTFADPMMDSHLQKKGPVILTIRVIHASDTITKVPVKCTYVGFGPDLQSDQFYHFSKDGLVRIVFNHHLPYQQVWLNIDHYLYAGLYVNKELTVTIDASKLKNSDGFYMIDDGVEYSGADGELNRVMNKHVLYKQDTRNGIEHDFYELAMTRKKYSENEFLAKFDSVYNALNSIDSEFIVHYPNFKWAIENGLRADYYGYLCVAHWFDKLPDTLFRRIDGFSPYFASNEGVFFYNYFFQYIIYKTDNPTFNIDEQLYSNYSNYSSEQKAVLDSLKYYSQLPENESTEAAKSSYEKKKRQLFLNEIEKISTNNLVHLIDSLYTSPKSDILKTFLLNTGKNAFADTYPEIMQSMHTNWCRNLVETELKKATIKQKQVDSLLSQGSRINDNYAFIGKPLAHLSFNADLYTLDSFKNADEFIVNLKSKFPNKALVIDFWATWCVPCLKELPVSKKLHENNEDLPIAFIYICTSSGSNITVWQNRIVGLQMPGTHIFADDKLVSELKSKFNSGGAGFPTYVVIDINGKLKPKAIEWLSYLDRDKLKNAAGL